MPAFCDSPLALAPALRLWCQVGLIVAALPVLAAEVSQTKKRAQVPVTVPRGLCSAPFSLKLGAPPDGGVVRYTLDGTEPSLTKGAHYSAPLMITNTTLLRAAAFKDGARVSAIATHSYIFLDQVLRQRNDPPRLPTGPRAWNGQPSAYQMDPRIVDHPDYRDRMRDAFLSLPIVSVVTPHDAIFGPGGLYLNSTQRGVEWEKPCSVEMILPDGSTAFQIDCGIRVQGNVNRIPNRSPKHSFRLLFKEQYGAVKLSYQVFPDSPVKKFDTLVLRADYNNSWIHWDPAARPRAQRTRDAWMKDAHRAMGWVAAHNRYVHLFLHGLYWGVYDFTERPDGNFAAAYLGGAREDYDVINEFEAKEGTLDAFNALHSVRGPARVEAYQKLQQLLDMTQYIDYLLLNYYAGNQDWGENKNWYAIRRHTPAAPFQYFVWDGEQVLQDVRDDTVSGPYEVPFRLAEALKANPEFRLAFADRVQKHLFDDGALTPGACAARWMKRANEVDRAVIAESARWGYYRRREPFTRDQDWLTEQQRLLQAYFPQRTAIVLEQFRAAGLYPNLAAPLLRRERDATGANTKLTMNSTNGGTIYYTTNGLDPRVAFTGAVAGHAMTYTKPVACSVAVKARVQKDGTWSALTELASAAGSGAP